MVRFADLPLGPRKQHLVVPEQKDSGFCGGLSPGAWISAGMKVTAGGTGGSPFPPAPPPRAPRDPPLRSSIPRAASGWDMSFFAVMLTIWHPRHPKHGTPAPAARPHFTGRQLHTRPFMFAEQPLISRSKKLRCKLHSFPWGGRR